MDGIIRFCAQYLIGFVALIFIYVAFKVPKPTRLKFLLGVVIALIVAAIIDKLAGKLYYDPRPFVSHNVKPLISHSADNGFPSDHTLLAMTLSTFLYFYRRKWAAMAFILTLVIGVARVAAHVHSPIDIIGGLVIGGIAGVSGYYLANKFLTTRGVVGAKN